MGLRTLLYIALGYVIWKVIRDVLDRSFPQRGAPPPLRDDPAPLDSACRTLGVEPDCTFAEAKAAYQSLIQKYHPDRVSSLGEELQEIAERRTKELNEAYQQLKQRQSPPS